MAVALRRVRGRVRARLRDTDARNPTWSDPEVDMAIADAYIALQARMPASSIETASGLTIAASADTFSLPTVVTQWTGGDGQAEYAGVVDIRLRSTGQFLNRVLWDIMNSRRNWLSANPTILAIPNDFALYLQKDQTVQGRCWPGCAMAQVCDLFVSLSADDLRDFVGSGAQGMDDVKVQFDRIATAALVAYAAADLLVRMTDEDLALRRLSRGAAPFWKQEAEISLYRSAARQNDMQDLGATQRWAP